MSVLEAHHPVQWVTAAPLWDTVLTPGVDATAQQRVSMRQPEILRFDSDEFMEQLEALLAEDPLQLAMRTAKPVSFRARPAGKPVGWTPTIEQLKLYQAVHGDFNLVAASLVCRIPGLPDRLVEPQNGDNVGFVLRRLHEGSELAWVGDPASENGRTWAELDAADAKEGAAVAAGEQVHPLFPSTFAEGDRTRRMFTGLIPTSNGETFKNAGVAALVPEEGQRTQPRTDPRLDELNDRVLVQVEAITTTVDAGSTRDMRVEASRFTLLDFADLLERELPHVRGAVSGGSLPAGGTKARELYDRLNQAIGTDVMTWRAALAAAWSQADAITGESDATPTLDVDLAGANVSNLKVMVEAALAERDAATGLPDPTTTEPTQPFPAPKYDLRGTTEYVIRCVYSQPQCGPLHSDVVSAPTRRFRIASYFDGDAPARPIHITMPFDTSIAGLRKSPKNVSFLISNELREQMNRVKDAKKALKGELTELTESGEIDLGVICAFSLPIITICALLLLMIIVSLLNMIFWWMPFFRICFPIPIFKSSAE